MKDESERTDWFSEDDERSSSAEEDLKKREKELEQKQKEMERIYYMAQAQLSRELSGRQGAEAMGVLTMTMDALGDIHEKTRTIIKDIRQDLKKDDHPEEDDELDRVTPITMQQLIEKDRREAGKAAPEAGQKEAAKAAPGADKKEPGKLPEKATTSPLKTTSKAPVKAPMKAPVKAAPQELTMTRTLSKKSPG